MDTRKRVGILLVSRTSVSVKCCNWHTICDEDVLDGESELPEDEAEREEYEQEYGGGFLPSRLCPVCQYIVLADADLAAYLLKETGVSRTEAFEEIKKANKRRKKLYDGEYCIYACQKAGLHAEDLLDQIKTRFPEYKDFAKYIERFQ